ncbi:C2 calcium/lipid-binding plant phosphoribosyltransferase family protein [Perilla frutescens var. hirtella]|uniref:C2 calcium/lipid-binding plant phosphoribosyltransferase family protein n=1 Tax=Perilla frutescens var. hirtella TaxID=608512 RepID=A0AAD4IYQ3_PERFH|nr:C2 calcium/lipid-binding plant phosphoribosyltransferase family protein [Perilla frutescens var. hirtella]
MHNNGKEKLVVEVVGAHNLMPKDGEGSSSAFVEVEFDNQRLRTQVKYQELNPVWEEKLIFHVNDVADLPYRTIEANVFNERRSNKTRNFLGKVRVSCSNVAREGEEQPQLHTLEKRSLFSHVRGELTLKLYLSTKEEVKQVVNGGGGGGGVVSKKNKKMQQQGGSLALPKQMGGQDSGKMGLWNPVEPGPGDLKPVVITALPGPVIPAGGGGGAVGLHHFRGGGVANEYALKETSPHLGGVSRDKTSSTYDLVEQMQYLYVRVVKARDLPVFGGSEVAAEVKLGNYRGITKRVSVGNAEWDQVFAFSKDCIQSSAVEVFLKESNKDDFLGRIWFDLNEVPKRVPPDSALAPQWYRMEDRKGERAKAGEVMVSIWFGTQADEAFAEAWHSKAANVHLDGLSSIKSMVYLSPKLWYLRVGVIEAQDVLLGEKGSSMNMVRYPELFAKVEVGNQVLRTRIASPGASRSLSNPYWNEELMFVVAEPFEDYLVVSIEDHLGGANRGEVVARFVVPVGSIERRMDDKVVVSRWFNLDTHQSNKGVARFASRIHLRASLEGGYHVLDEATLYSSDVRPTAKQLWKPHIGVLEVGILGASNLIPMKIKQGKGRSTDAYCVAKYGQKWIRTRTVVDSLAPKWNEQYTWEVFDPCTVISIGLFDNSRVDTNMNTNIRDTRIGKVRIRLSTLEADRVYTHAYPLVMLLPSGVKKMGDLHLAVRFSCTNTFNVLNMYAMPLLPKMHYVQPLSVAQLDTLRYQATNVVASRLNRAEPPLGREVVEYMLDHDSQMWSMRKSKANFLRLTNVLAWLVAMWKLVEMVRSWHKPVYSAMFVAALIVLVLLPELIIPCILLTMAATGLWRYRGRPRHPPHMDTRLSYAESVYPDELDEELDTFPTSRSPEVVRMRYDRLRSVAGRIQTVVGDLATQGERFQALLSWRDPRATFLFVIVCLVAAFGFYLVPIRWVVAAGGVYWLRPPKFRSRMPSCAESFFKRLPSNADSML